MKQSKLVVLGLVAGLGLMANGAEAGYLIDDFNLNSPSNTVSDATDDTPVTGGNAAPRTNPTGTVLSGWDREQIYTHLVSGDGVTTADCENCDVGHFITGPNDVGNGYWSWKSEDGAADTFSGAFSFLYGTDVPGQGIDPGVDFVVSFVNDGLVTYQYQWSDVPGIGLPGTPGSLSVGLNGVLADQIFLDVFTVGGIFDPQADSNYQSYVSAGNFLDAAFGADVNIDNVQVPEPATLALIGLGFAALGWNRRRVNRVVMPA